MTAILVTGMSGVGKSSVAAELRRRGFSAVDTDAEASRVAPDGEWLWDERKVERALDATSGDALVFIVGSASNQVQFYRRFDLVVLLTAPADLMLERVGTRTTNPFGSTSEERQKILADKQAFEPMMRRRAHLEISTVQPLSSVVDELLAAAQRISDRL
jgi:dephospho-CoA kinase